MASTGTALYPGASTFPGASVFPGQGTNYIARCYLSTDDASVGELRQWSDVTSKMRSFATSRGRNSERDQFDAGTATVVLDNRDRSFDPVINSAIKPLNRIWLFEEFSGERQDIYEGYAETIQQNWDASGIVDATATFTCADEFKVLSLVKMPATDPPRGTYEDIVLFDVPGGYWQFKNTGQSGGSAPFPGQGTVGPALDLQPNGSLVFSGGQGAIVGESFNNAGYVGLGGSGRFYAPSTFAAGDPGDPSGGTEMSVEAWISTSSLPGGTQIIAAGPATGANNKWKLSVTSAGAFEFKVVNSVPTTFTVTGGTLTTDSTWYHVVGEVRGGNVILYVNGTQVATTAWSGNFAATINVGATLAIGDSATTVSFNVDEVAWYDYGLPAARIAAHYTAGAQRGVPRNQATGSTRIGAVLDAVSSTAPRSLQTGSRNSEGEFYGSQAPIDMIHHALEAENVDAGFFVARTGTLTYLADGHRSSSPYNTVQMTFDDDGTDSPYMDCTLDFSEVFLSNEINVTGSGGTLSTASDATSISRYFKRSLSISSEFIVAANASAIATALLAKYKDPFTRVTTIKPKMADAETMRLVFQRDLMDRIEIFRTPPGGGARIDQVSFIQKIEISGTPGVPPDVTLGVSPL